MKRVSLSLDRLDYPLYEYQERQTAQHEEEGSALLSPSIKPPSAPREEAPTSITNHSPIHKTPNTFKKPTLQS